MNPTPTNLRSLLPLLASEPSLDQVISGRQNALVVGEPARGFVVAGLAEASESAPILVVVANHSEAERLASDIEAVLGDKKVALFSPWQTLPFERVSPSIETMGQRLELLWRLKRRATRPQVIVASVGALLQRIDPNAATEPITIACGAEIDQAKLIKHLVEFGYRREPQVEHRGEFGVRGSIVDIFPSTTASPVRVDLWGDEVDRLAKFGVADQRSTNSLDELQIFPCREFRPTPEGQRRAENLIGAEPWGREHWEKLANAEMFDGMESWLPWIVDEQHILPDLLDEEAYVVLVEPQRIRNRAEDIAIEEADLADSLAITWEVLSDSLHRLHLPYERLLASCKAPVLAMPLFSSSEEMPVYESMAWAPLAGEIETSVSQLHELLGKGFSLVVAAQSQANATRLEELLAENGVVAKQPSRLTDLAASGAHLVDASLNRGAVFSSLKLAILCEADLTGRRRSHRPARSPSVQAQAQAQARQFFDDLREGSYVVHAHYGVARFAGMVSRAVNGSERDYLLLAYRGTDRLYVPSDQVDMVRMYNGGETPTLSRLGGADWRASKARVRSAAAEIAQELVVLYQKRLSTAGHAFATDSPWQGELEHSFAFQETPDQLQAVADVKGDMERAAPMDRLIIGDVGYGKTEVALRAVFKAVLDGAQAAVLVPTTLLAQQHHATFAERLAPYPVKVEVLSRFLTNAQARSVIAQLKSGSADVVIGTHRLLSEDVKFKNLRLLVVDEEQRFGVKHKEQIKAMRQDVDVLTLTATPIPRTMEMGLVGIRDMSVLKTAPADRQPILTHVGEYDERAVGEAIRRELLREGQLFFVHNRIRDIEFVATSLRKLVPEARIAVAHGQMDEGTLEQIVIDFWEGNYDVLVCTTIIESGIDMPTVNTLVVSQAHKLGLGQLHQLRGRVGRASQRAYAYLFHPPDVVLSEQAYERLKTIGEATELGSGFRIAMRDLELRGAGNLLGTGQSGHIAAVGYDLYCQMVTEAVAELKGEKPKAEPKITIDVPGDAFLPTDYVGDQASRLEAYRRLSTLETQEMLDDVRAEWLDRFGPLPPAAQSLLLVGQLRLECLRTSVREVVVSKMNGFGGATFVARLAPVALPYSKQVRLQRLYSGARAGGSAKFFEAKSELRVPLREKDGPLVQQILELMTDLLPDQR